MKRAWENFKRRFIRDENGAVSIYLIIVILLLFVFNAVLIDFARIMVAEHQTETTAQKALRSVFSAYEKKLQQKGVYAYYSSDESSAEEIFNSVFEQNMAAEGNYFKFIDNKMESSSISWDESRSLANVDVLEHQILEDMKYRAPVEYGKLVVEQFMPVACAMEKASAFTDVASEVEKEFQQRSEVLQQLKSDLKEAERQIELIKKAVYPNHRSENKYPTVKAVGDLNNHYPKYADNPSSEDASDFEDNVNELTKKLVTKTKSTNKQLDEAQKALDKAKKENEKIKKKIKELRKDNEHKYDRVKDKCAQADDAGLNEANSSIDDYVIPDESFNEMEDAIELAITETENMTTKTLLSKVQHVDSVMDNVFNNDPNSAENVDLKTLAREISIKRDVVYDQITKARDEFSAEIPDQYYEDDAEVSKYKKSAKDRFKEAQKLLNMANGISSDFDDYNKLSENLAKYNGANAIQVELGDNPEQGADSSMQMVDNLFNSLGEMMTGVRNEAYVNEYIMTRFMSVQDPGELSSCNGAMYKCPEAYLYENREVEYILYGIHEPAANYGAALTELFFTRLALNMASELSTNETVRAIPHPWAKFWVALAAALNQTIQDMEQLTKGNTVPLIDLKSMRRSIQTDYKFYLRLYLFLHPEGDTLHRVQASLDKSASSVEMDQLPTYITGEVESSIDLWFLPGIADMLGRANVINGEVKDGRYMISKEVHYSY
ncbi:hypothetical protein [Thalassobacillus hwangdonensis]|uniref:Flp pilus-assembly TadG-like N-terminal domain-containing protein n=1 Tax=Thalassobacillus hwangdonensis TaxID=546108 RepID=A0ABW3KVU1_9BACI